MCAVDLPMTMARHLFISLLLIHNVAVHAAGIYTWIDDRGKKHFSDTPPADTAYESVEVKETPAFEVLPDQAPDGRIIRLREEHEARGRRLKQEKQARLEEKDAEKHQRLEQARRCAVAQQERAHLTNRPLVYGLDKLRRESSGRRVIGDPIERTYPEEAKTLDKVRYFDREIAESCGDTREALKRQDRAGEELYACPELNRFFADQRRLYGLEGIDRAVAERHYNTYCK